MSFWTRRNQCCEEGGCGSNDRNHVERERRAVKQEVHPDDHVNASRDHGCRMNESGTGVGPSMASGSQT